MAPATESSDIWAGGAGTGIWTGQVGGEDGGTEGATEPELMVDEGEFAAGGAELAAGIPEKLPGESPGGGAPAPAPQLLRRKQRLARIPARRPVMSTFMAPR